MKRISVLTAAAMALFLMAGTVSAQTKGAVEIGVDNGILVNINQDLTSNSVLLVEGNTNVEFDVPFLLWRFGYFVNEQWSIEPGIGFLFASFGGDNGSVASITGNVDVVYNLPSGLLFNVGGVIDYTNVDPGGSSSSSSTSQFGAGGGVGYRVPLINQQIQARLGARYFYLFKSTDDFLPASHNILGTFGISIFTK